jgi:hypothetical protein
VSRASFLFELCVLARRKMQCFMAEFKVEWLLC